MTQNAIAWNKLLEEQRHNKEQERLSEAGLAVNWANYAETVRSNTAREAIDSINANTRAMQEQHDWEKTQFDMKHYWSSTLLGHGTGGKLLEGALALGGSQLADVGLLAAGVI